MTANASGIAWSFKTELLDGIHALGTTVTRGGTGADTLKAALYLQASSVTPGAITAYTATGEVSGTGYTAGGVTVTNATAPAGSSGTSYWTPSANIVYSSVTLGSAFDCCLIYNSTQSNRAVCILTFAAQTISAGTFTITVPTNGPSSALMQLS